MNEHHVRISHRPEGNPGWGNAEVMVWCADCGWYCFTSAGQTLDMLTVIQVAHQNGENGWEYPPSVDRSIKAMTPDGIQDVVPPWLVRS